MGLALVMQVIDRCLYVWWLKPFEQLSIQIQYWGKRRDIVTVMRLFWERGNEQTKLVLTSLGFALIWPFLAVYVLTSTMSVTAIGMVMGLGLQLALSLMKGLQNISTMETWFCWQIKRSFSEKELRGLAVSFIGLFGVITATLLAG